VTAGKPLKELRVKLLRRVDVLPPSMVIVQGAIESGWLMSRFARTGQAVFGQWTTGKSGMKARRSKAKLLAFDNPRQALRAYMLNINTHPAYAELRRAREQLRQRQQPLDGYLLAGYLGRYAAIGKDYVRLVRRMIRQNDLKPLDGARLAPGSPIHFRIVEAD
jgi:Bax protein